MQTMTPQIVTVQRTHRPVGRTPSHNTLPLLGGVRHPSQERRTEHALTSLIHSFVRCRRAAATALLAAVMTLMSVGGIAMVSDHAYLVYQRDTLKAAADAATTATTRHLLTLSPGLTDAQVGAVLESMAERYILANMPESQREDVAESLVLTLDADRGAGTVNIVAQADLGGIIFGSWLYGNPVQGIQVGSLTERVENITEVVLAIDVTGSMRFNILGEQVNINPTSARMYVVKEAALTLVDFFDAVEGNSIAIGLVPWDYRVRVDDPTRWQDNGWAQYQNPRYYPSPHSGNPTGAWQDVPAMPEVWQGCVDPRALTGTPPPGLSAALPAQTPFTMGFYPPMVTKVTHQRVGFECLDETTTFYNQDLCYSDPLHRIFQSPQFECPDSIPAIAPLTTDLAAVKSKIEGLQAVNLGPGHATNSALGVAWGHRLLAPTWRTIWGDAAHPIDLASAPEGSQKVLVLLTDGEDNNPDITGAAARRSAACTAAKEAGIKVFAIAAMHRSLDGSLPGELEACSSQADDPSGTYVFVNHPSAASISQAFQNIARQLVQFRRVY